MLNNDNWFNFSKPLLFYAWDIVLAQYKQHQAICLWDKHDGNNQRWRIQHEDGDFYKFYSCGNDKYCLDIKAENGGQWDGSGFLNRVKIAKENPNSKSQLFNLGCTRVVDQNINFLGYMTPDLQ